jgi:phosphatidylglycerophosphatase A
VILDEFVVMPICFLGLDSWILGGQAWLVLLLGFLLFRLFDISKPFFIGQLDKIDGGWGILLDDVAAALVTCVCLHGLFTLGMLERVISLWK